MEEFYILLRILSFKMFTWFIGGKDHRGCGYFSPDFSPGMSVIAFLMEIDTKGKQHKGGYALWSYWFFSFCLAQLSEENGTGIRQVDSLNVKTTVEITWYGLGNLNAFFGYQLFKC